MKALVSLTARARGHAWRIDSWWRENRPSAPDAFADELAKAIDLLTEAPRVGQEVSLSTPWKVRRLFLRKSRHSLYYVYQQDRAAILILAIWSPLRREPPPI